MVRVTVPTPHGVPIALTPHSINSRGAGADTHDLHMRRTQTRRAPVADVSRSPFARPARKGNLPPMNHLRDLATIVLVNLAALGLIVHRLRDPRATAVRIEPAPTVTPAPSPTAIVVTVHVAGAVRRPAVVRLREGARIADAVAAAGGLADGASPALNLAAALTDGAQVYVLRTGEAAPAAGAVVGAAGASASTDGEMSGAASPPSGPIDINRAAADELDALPGVGPALAARIVAWRTANGPFTAVEDLLGVAGIGERTLERLREGVVVR